MNITIISVGKKRAVEYVRLESDYIKRLPSHIRILEKRTRHERSASRSTVEQDMEKEALAIEKLIPSNSYVCALDRSGTQLTSIGFSKFLNRRFQSGGGLCFIIGGASGLHSSILERSGTVISLSKMTFPHDMVPLILAEQVYRAVSILQGGQYHK